AVREGDGCRAERIGKEEPSEKTHEHECPVIVDIHCPQEHAEHGCIDSHHQQRVQERPGNSQGGTLVLEFEVSDSQIGDELAVSPQLSHSEQGPRILPGPLRYSSDIVHHLLPDNQWLEFRPVGLSRAICREGQRRIPASGAKLARLVLCVNLLATWAGRLCTPPKYHICAVG